MSDAFHFDSQPPPPNPAPPRPLFPSPAAPEPERTGRGCGFWAGWLLALVFLATSGLLLLAVMGLSVRDVVVEDTAEKRMIEKTVSGSGANKILLVPIMDIISDQPREQGSFRVLPGLVTSIRHQLRQAERDPDIKAVVIRVDSPGGGITASDIIHEEIKRYKSKTRNKVVACMEDIAASGGYYVSVPADKIIAHPTSITGSIGVIMLHANIEGLLQNLGITASPIKSGPMKDIGSWMRDMTPEEQKVLQDMINEMYDRFVQVISAGRTAAGAKMTPPEVRKLADGRIYTAQQAKDLRLIDQIGYLDDAIEAAKQLARIKEAKVVQYFYPAFSIFDLLSGKAVGRPTISLSFEALTTPRPPRIMYLWTGGLMKSQ